MSHHVYTTDAYVIDSSPAGEANKIYTLFTRDLGMIRGTAQGVRLLKSKLRFALQDFSLAKVSVVRGKDIWRVTNARAVSNLYESHKEEPHTIKAVAQIFALLRRLLQGEDGHADLFSYVSAIFDFIEGEKITSEEMMSLEAIAVLTILHKLGYLGSIAELNSYIAAPIDREMLGTFAGERRRAYAEINRSLRETQL